MGLKKFRKRWQKKQAELSKSFPQNLQGKNQVNVDCVVASINKFVREKYGIEDDSNLIINPRFATK
jgi:hypothetical protein